MMDGCVQEFLKVAEEAATAGGRIVLQHRYQPLEIKHKARREVVTNVDKLADKAICHILRRYFPDHTIVSEESGIKQTTSEYTWIIDPLDGTESYIRGQNFSGVTIALTKEGQTILGVVYHPFHNELYTAFVGGETTVNGHPVHVTRVAKLEHALLILDYSPRDALRKHLYAIEWERGFKQIFRIGRSGRGVPLRTGTESAQELGHRRCHSRGAGRGRTRAGSSGSVSGYQSATGLCIVL
jgi:fructose-1,6-bisphosphatase/inositol monophosphatase family enzyme